MQPQAELSFTELVLNASFLVQCVMLFLLALSIISWTIIFTRNSLYRNGRIKADDFEERFWSGIDLNNLYHDCMERTEELVGLEVIYSAGFKEFVRLVNSGPANQDVVMDGTYRQMKVACSREIELLESHLPTLATIGSISPYIGLFGTVWGIMHAFVSLAAVKNATLAMVAPPIAEALIATAMGLFAAIPAVMFYNRFVTKVEALENRYYNFMDEFSTILNRRLVTIRNQLNRQGNTLAPMPRQDNAQNMADNNMYQEQSDMAMGSQEQNHSEQINNLDSNAQNLNNQAPVNNDLNKNNMLANANMANANLKNNIKGANNVANNMALNQNAQQNIAMTDMSSQAEAMAQSLHNQSMVNTHNANLNNANVANKARPNAGHVNMMQGNNQALTANMSATQPRANVNQQMNDPRMMANYRGVVPPRNQPQNNAQVQMANGFKPQAKKDAPFYKGSTEFNKVRQQNNNNDDQPHYIAPGGQNHNNFK